MPKEGYTTGKEPKIVRDKDVSDYYVIVTRVERIDYHYRVVAVNEEQAIEFAVDEYNPITEKDIISLDNQFVETLDWEARVEESL
ncbi:MAG: hypothetical protein H7645_11425 [Candidatus Heimdallarchaeota archaeon]|nr:hypothetical protein [Candidatus Heimdallarchaeota archaeon]MCK4770935.1 hypothetical protein [Candidatus Heimdallarchaeota archaeon]